MKLFLYVCHCDDVQSGAYLAARKYEVSEGGTPKKGQLQNGYFQDFDKQIVYDST